MRKRFKVSSHTPGTCNKDQLGQPQEGEVLSKWLEMDRGTLWGMNVYNLFFLMRSSLCLYTLWILEDLQVFIHTVCHFRPSFHQRIPAVHQLFAPSQTGKLCSRTIQVWSMNRVLQPRMLDKFRGPPILWAPTSFIYFPYHTAPSILDNTGYANWDHFPISQWKIVETISTRSTILHTHDSQRLCYHKTGTHGPTCKYILIYTLPGYIMEVNGMPLRQAFSEYQTGELHFSMNCFSECISFLRTGWYLEA